MRRALILALAPLWAAGAALAVCPPASEAEVYPTARVLPANLLRMYVYFPRPMSMEAGVRDVAVLDASGTPVPGVFLETRQDLWSPDRRRLTLLLDPGRVKTGLLAHEALGRALVVGAGYTLEVSDTVLDRNGCPLGQRLSHRFTVGEADGEPPAPGSWVMTVPDAGTTAPLIVALGSAHDHLSLAYRLRVKTAEGATVRGALALGPGERSWHFTPAEPWAPAAYTLAVDARLEDLAGNRPGHLFDRPADAPPQPWISARPFRPPG